METLDDEPMNFSAQTTSQLDCKLLKWTLTQEQTKAIEKAYEGYKDSRECSFEEFCERVRNFSIIPVENKNGIVGAIMIRKNEIHISVTEPFNMRKYIKTVFNPLFKNYLEVVTTVIKSNTKGLQFVKRLGFEEVNRKDNIIYLRMDHGWSC
jgi:hypothetical protein